jgi:hypothetical protein
MSSDTGTPREADGRFIMSRSELTLLSIIIAILGLCATCFGLGLAVGVAL